MNVWKQFEQLFPTDPLQVGTVLSHNDDGTSSVELPGSITIRAVGQGVEIGQKAFVQTGRIQGEAPDLPTYTIAI